ncbi:MAG: trehalose-6-phosphate synthase [Bacteroidetes bacterium QS_8_68_28]|nr:MAG: trehalose-6-phosphate synthase [Bacteroidetes bacterium QS_8_68_28]
MRLTVVANRAPISRTEEGDWVTSVGGLTTALLPVLSDQGGTWVAMGEEPDLPEQQDYPAEDPNFRVRRVPLSQEELDGYYYGMANSVLWPLSHYMVQHLDLRDEFFEHYRQVNERFAEAVNEEYQEGDVIWMQDYHLTFAPALVREAHPDAVMGHFWHIPWPAMEVFRILPGARKILRGMLGNDLIGFHVEEYAKNFVESAEVLLGAEVERPEGIIHWKGREVHVEAHPIGIEVGRFERMSESDKVKRETEEVREEFGAESLVVGIDRLDYTKGVLSRLKAFEEFLEENPDYHGKVSLFQVATPSRTEVESYQQLKREVDEAVGRINGQFAGDYWVPVHYRYRTYTQEELCSFYRAADVALITPLRDGMNLVTQEFITAATEQGVIILSELTGAAYLLPEALQVNPYDQSGLAEAIRTAIEMPDEERRDRIRALKSTVADLNVHRWADDFLDRLAARREGS